MIHTSCSRYSLDTLCLLPVLFVPLCFVFLVVFCVLPFFFLLDGVDPIHLLYRYIIIACTRWLVGLKLTQPVVGSVRGGFIWCPSMVRTLLVVGYFMFFLWGGHDGDIKVMMRER